MVIPQNSTWIIRDGREQDYPTIAAIYNQAILAGGITFHEQTVSAAYIHKWVAKFCDRESLLVLENNAQILGWGVVKQYSDRSGYRFCCETSIYLDDAVRGKGYGNLLQKALLTKVTELNYHHVVLKIVATNQSSIRFHEKFGFEIVGTQKEIGFTQGRWQDVVIMQLVLPHVPLQ